MMALTFAILAVLGNTLVCLMTHVLIVLQVHTPRVQAGLIAIHVRRVSLLQIMVNQNVTHALRELMVSSRGLLLVISVNLAHIIQKVVRHDVPDVRRVLQIGDHNQNTHQIVKPVLQELSHQLVLTNVQAVIKAHTALVQDQANVIYVQLGRQAREQAQGMNLIANHVDLDSLVQ